MASPRATTSRIPSSKPRDPLATERGVLAEAVAGAGGRREPDALDGIEHDEAEDGGGQLGVLGLRQLLDGSVEQQVGQIAVGGIRGFLDDFP